MADNPMPTGFDFDFEVVEPTEFDVEFEQSTPDWMIYDVIAQLALKAEYLDVYVGNDIAEYDPEGSPIMVRAGALIHEKGTKYICRALAAQSIIPPTHLPTETDSNYQVYTLIDYIHAYVQEHSDALIYKGTLTGGSTESTTTYTPAAEKGYLYKVASGAYINKVRVDPGDVLICNSDATPAGKASNVDIVKTKWDVVQTNIDTIDGKFSNSITVGTRESGTTIGDFSSAEGYDVEASGVASHAEGRYTNALGEGSHAEGIGTTASAAGQHTVGKWNIIDSNNNYVEIVGNGSSPVDLSNARTLDWNGNEVISGNETVNGGIIIDDYISMGRKANTTIGTKSFATGSAVEASGVNAHAEGSDTVASNSQAHAEGYGSVASQPNAHAEGVYTQASKTAAHAEGYYSVANGNNSHGEGFHTVAEGQSAHAEGNRTYAAGLESHAQGFNTVTYTKSGTVLGKYNLPGSTGNILNWQQNTKYYINQCVKQDNKYWLCKSEHTSETNFDSSKWVEIPNDTTDYAEIVGGGTAIDNRSNVRTLDFSGNEVLLGKLTVGTAPTNNMDVTTKQYVDNKISTAVDALDGSISGSPSKAKTLTAFSETNGVVSATFGNIAIPMSQVTDIGTAAGKGVDANFDNLESVNLPTTAAVASYIEEWMTYQPITINTLTVNPASAEHGSTVTSATFTYAISKLPKSAMLDTDTQTITATSGSFTKSSLLLTSNKTWTLQVTEDKPDRSSYSTSKTVKLTFMYRVFYGAAAIPSTINSAFVRGLSGNPLDSDGKVNFTATAVKDGQTDIYVWYASTSNACSFNVGGFDGGFESPTVVTVKDAGNNDVTYYVYRSTNPNLGTISVTVK